MERKGLDKQPKEAKSKNSDSELVSMMGMAMLDNGGMQVIEKALQGSEDPGQVFGNFMAQLIGQIAEFGQSNLGIDPGIFLQEDGFLDQMLGYIERKLKLPPEFSDQVYGETLEVVKAAASGGEQQASPGGGPAPAPGQAPPAPAAGGPPGLDGGM